MVIRFQLIILLAYSVSACALTQSSYEGGDDYWKPRPYEMTPVKSIVINNNGARSEGISGDETSEFCAEFILEKNNVMKFFTSARRASYKEYWHDLDMSGCFAAGDIEFVNGDYGNWRIDLMRRGVVELSDSRNIYFYCELCQAEVFDEL